MVPAVCVCAGFNPPELVQARANPLSRFIFLHEYGDEEVPYTYTWQHVGCSNGPAYVCVNGDDPVFESKWPSLQALLMSSLSSLLSSLKVRALHFHHQYPPPTKGPPFMLGSCLNPGCCQGRTPPESPSYP